MIFRRVFISFPKLEIFQNGGKIASQKSENEAIREQNSKVPAGCSLFINPYIFRCVFEKFRDLQTPTPGSKSVTGL